MEQILDTNNYTIDKSLLADYFCQGFKNKPDFKIGVEFEKIGIYAKNHHAVNYFGETGASELLRQLRDNHNEIAENDNLFGFLEEEGNVTLEPGCQLEYSTKPFKKLADVETAFTEFNRKTASLGHNLGIKWLGCGIQPVSTYENIRMIPKERYRIMRKYLPKKGNTSLVMMMETAGTQASIDYESEEDAMKKLRVILGISPVLTAMFSNSPIRAGKLTGYKSYRAYSWLNTDNDRCGLISKKIFDENFEFIDYIEVLLDVPMFFIKRENQLIDTTGMTFRKYIKNGFKGFSATMDDWFLHMTTFFPDIRLKNYLEVRNCDCQKNDMAMAFPAILKGIVYNEDAMDEALSLVKSLNWLELNELRSQVPKYGLDLKINKFKLSEIAKELVSIAEFSLKSENNETIYLEKIKELVSEGKTPADIIIMNWNSSWNQDIRKFIEYSEFN